MDLIGLVHYDTIGACVLNQMISANNLPNIENYDKLYKIHPKFLHRIINSFKTVTVYDSFQRQTFLGTTYAQTLNQVRQIQKQSMFEMYRDILYNKLSTMLHLKKG